MWTTVVKESKSDDFVMKPVVIEDVDAIIIELVGKESIGDKELAEEDDDKAMFNEHWDIIT